MLGRRALEGLRSRGAGGGVHGVGVVALASDLKAVSVRVVQVFPPKPKLTFLVGQSSLYAWLL